MAYEYIDREECIGDSLFKINNNSVNFDTRINELSSSSSPILAVHIHTFSDSTVRSGNLRNYGTITNGNKTIISTKTNSKFLITLNGQGYTAPGTAGANIGLNRTILGTAVRVLGTDGNNGDSWMGTSNGYTGAFSITRSCLDTPNVIAGTSITYNFLLGHWNAGTSYINYPAYSGLSSMVIYEMP